MGAGLEESRNPNTTRYCCEMWTHLLWLCTLLRSDELLEISDRILWTVCDGRDERTGWHTMNKETVVRNVPVCKKFPTAMTWIQPDVKQHDSPALDSDCSVTLGMQRTVGKAIRVTTLEGEEADIAQKRSKKRQCDRVFSFQSYALPPCPCRQEEPRYGHQKLPPTAHLYHRVCRSR